MARRLRFIPEGGALVEVTCRTMHGRFLLKPSPRLNRIIAGILARAQRLYPAEIHAFVFLSNHFHLLLSVPHAQRLAQFMSYFSGNLAREAGKLANWQDKFWSRRYQAIVVSHEDAAQIARIRYILAHGIKEGLGDGPSRGLTHGVKRDPLARLQPSTRAGREARHCVAILQEET